MAKSQMRMKLRGSRVLVCYTTDGQTATVSGVHLAGDFLEITGKLTDGEEKQVSAKLSRHLLGMEVVWGGAKQC
jgi:hypothetical protein